MADASPLNVTPKGWANAEVKLDSRVLDLVGSGDAGMSALLPDGTFKLKECGAGGAEPAFCMEWCFQERWLYYDLEGRWHIGLKEHARHRRHGLIGFLRTCPVDPGTLPHECDAWEALQNGIWHAQPSMNVYSVISVPILTLHSSAAEQDGSSKIICTSMSGTEVAVLHTFPDQDSVRDLRERLANISMQGLELQLALPDGRFLGDSEDCTLLASVLCR